MPLISKKLDNFVTPQSPKTVPKKLPDGDTSETFIDLTKIKEGGVPIDEVIDSLKRLRK